jgi:hypothetical protein
MYAATERIDRDFYTAAHKHTFYMCSVSEGKKGLFSTEISVKRVQLNYIRFLVCLPRNIPKTGPQINGWCFGTT